MNKISNVILLTFLFCQSVIAQNHRDFPSTLNYFSQGDNMISNQICSETEVKHREVVSEAFGKEYYCSGNIHAEGVLKKTTSREVSYPKEEVMTEYVRDGEWNTYFDSTTKVLRSKGSYQDGEKHGKWIVYSEDGKVLYNIEYSNGYLKSKIFTDRNGERKTVFQRSEMSLFATQYKTLLILGGILPIVLLRISWNILTYNKIHKTNYIPMLQNFQEGGFLVNIYSTFTFWWFIKKGDEEGVKKYKRIANVVSVFSIICLAVSLFFLRHV